MKEPPGLHHGILEQIRALHQDAAALRKMGRNSTTDDFAEWISAGLAAGALRAAEEAGPDGLPLEMLLQFSAALEVLRRGDHRRARLELRREEIEIGRERVGKWMEARFDKWVEDPEVQARFMPKPFTPEEQEQRILDVFGMTELPEHVMRKAREQVRAEDRAKAEAEAQAQAEGNAGAEAEAEDEDGEDFTTKKTKSTKRREEGADDGEDSTAQSSQSDAEEGCDEHGPLDAPDYSNPWHPRPPRERQGDTGIRAPSG